MLLLVEMLMADLIVHLTMNSTEETDAFFVAFLPTFTREKIFHVCATRLVQYVAQSKLYVCNPSLEIGNLELTPMKPGNT